MKKVDLGIILAYPCLKSKVQGGWFGLSTHHLFKTQIDYSALIIEIYFHFLLLIFDSFNILESTHVNLIYEFSVKYIYLKIQNTSLFSFYPLFLNLCLHITYQTCLNLSFDIFYSILQ